MSVRRFTHCFFISAALLCLFLVPAQADPIDLDKLYGPRIDKLCLVIITNPDVQVMAAESGALDLVSDITRPSDIERLARSPRLEMSLARGYHGFFLMMNNKAAPWNDPVVRRAAAQAIDRNNIVRMIYSGYCEPINSWVPPVSRWALPDTGHNRFDPATARELLKKSGYTWSLTGYLVTPDGKPLPKIKLISPMARVAPTTQETAERIADSLVAVGFPVEVEPMDFATLISKVDRRDYSLTVMAWAPIATAKSLYSFYHSSSDVEAGYNITSTSDSELDRVLHAVRYAANKAAAERASAEAQRRLSEIVPSVPIYSRFSISAVSKRWENIQTSPNMTAANIWTILAAEPKNSGQRIFNMLLTEEPRNLNPLVTSSAYSWQVLGYIYESLLTSDPWTLEDRPALARSWRVGTETSGGRERTVLEFDIRDDVFWNDGQKFTVHDVKATIEFIRKHQPPRFYDSIKGVEEVIVSGDYHLTVRMRDVSYWQLDEIGGLLCLPKHVLDKVTDWQNWNPTDKSGRYGPYGLVGTGPFMYEEYRPGEYLMMNKNPHYRLLKNKKASGAEASGK